MNICNKPREKKFIAGLFYRGFSGNMYIATGEGYEKINLLNGLKEFSSHGGGAFVDVTDKYCLKEI